MPVCCCIFLKRYWNACCCPQAQRRTSALSQPFARSSSAFVYGYCPQLLRQASLPCLTSGAIVALLCMCVVMGSSPNPADPCTVSEGSETCSGVPDRLDCQCHTSELVTAVSQLSTLVSPQEDTWRGLFSQTYGNPSQVTTDAAKLAGSWKALFKAKRTIARAAEPWLKPSAFEVTSAIRHMCIHTPIVQGLRTVTVVFLIDGSGSVNPGKTRLSADHFHPSGPLRTQLADLAMVQATSLSCPPSLWRPLKLYAKLTRMQRCFSVSLARTGTFVYHTGLSSCSTQAYNRFNYARIGS